MIIPVILAGGVGTRLWPVSRNLRPKQFLNLCDKNYSLFQQTLQRLDFVGDVTPPIILCNQEHRFLVAQQCKDISVEPLAVFLEPCSRNTAPAAALAAQYALSIDKNAVLLILPADHLIDDSVAFGDVIRSVQYYVEQEYLATLGIDTRSPETGYGYIHKGSSLGDKVYKIVEFIEKPAQEKANSYVKTGEYYWNAGIFLFKASIYLNELKQHKPQIYAISEAAYQNRQSDLDFIRIPEDIFSTVENTSIDYAVMENTDKAIVACYNSGWSDIGAWSSLWQVLDKDDDDNVVRGDVILSEVRNSYVYTDKLLVTAVGVDNLTIVCTEDAILVADKSSAQKVKHIVQTLIDNNRDEVHSHSEVFRPWGSYKTLIEGNKHKVKIIKVLPNASLSLQTHNYRAEHWVVVSGIATVTCDDNRFDLKKNESTYIPSLSKHRLENQQDAILEVIEIQTGDYLGEDDIVRFEDHYGRLEKKIKY